MAIINQRDYWVNHPALSDMSHLSASIHFAILISKAN